MTIDLIKITLNLVTFVGHFLIIYYWVFKQDFKETVMIMLMTIIMLLQQILLEF